ncbi:MAG: hypothetical protein P9L96_01455 [Candidatus Gygaella obscura]|nr:hypothetical protein [Candidatus Gygaella obscura]
MNNILCKRSIFKVANKYQKKVMMLVFWTALISIIISSVTIYLMSFLIIASEMPDKAFISLNIIPAAGKSAIVLVLLVIMWLMLIIAIAQRISNKLVGPIDRLYRDLDEIGKLGIKKHIHFRKGDDLSELATKINKIVDRIPANK